MHWVRGLGSLKVSAALLVLLFLSVLGATVAQGVWGPAAVQTTFLGHAWFEAGGWIFPGLPALLALTGLNLAVGAWMHLERSIRHLGLWGVHLSLVFFCFGSLGLSLAQEDLVLGLVPGASADRAFVRDASSEQTRPLPFVLTLEDFHIETYPESAEPSDYVSRVRLNTSGESGVEIRMNQPLRQDGWTIYQSSVQDVDGVAAPVFKLMHNPWGAFPYLVSLSLVLSLLVHAILSRRPRPYVS